ncbi:hypothetical protein ACO2Q0_21495 [Phenylobacterium sp. VNQ135]|uniref:hypothetical protein n=1 Tax=Phenylobacterium sp. VNQ135 TaxID=3400922 RepID=UPI003C07C551
MSRIGAMIASLGLALGGASAAAGQSVPAPPVEPKHASYAKEIAAAQERLDAFMAAFNARDVKAFEATFNFPHVRFASNKVTVINPGFHTPAMFGEGALSEWHHSAWQRRQVIHAGPDKVHIDTRFARFRADGSLIGAFDSIYIVTRVDGRWGIQGRSSFAP